MLPPRSLTACSFLPPEGVHFSLGRPGGKTVPPRSLTACTVLPPEGGAAPAAWQSQFRGPCLGMRGRYFFDTTNEMTELLAVGI